MNTVTYGDAISNQVIAMDQMFQKLGLESSIFCEKLDTRVSYSRIQQFSLLKAKAEDHIIFHFSTGTSFVDKVLKLPYEIVLYYHNITPPEFYIGNAWGSFFASRKGRQQLLELRTKTKWAWGASDYSRQELNKAGFVNTSVLPIIVNFSTATISPSPAIIGQFQDDWKNILFVGRVTPHKKQEDLIKTVYYYKQAITEKVRLFIVGGQKASYQRKLEQMSHRLGLEQNVVFTGKVTDADLNAYYELADAFLCMSEHEGFCVPLLEAMQHRIPVFAYDSSAIPDTLGKAGVLFDQKDFGFIAELVNFILNDAKLLNSILDAQTQRLQDFSQQVMEQTLIRELQKVNMHTKRF